jgi:multidrug efflux system outer membrane protein
LVCGSEHPVKPPPSQVTVPGAFEERAPEGRPSSEQELAQWWTVWHDPVLAQLITEALQANTDIRIAQRRVAEARAMVTVAESALYPTVSASGAVLGGGADWRVATSPSTTLPAVLDTAGAGFYGGALGLGASWEPDVWGGRAADVKAAQAVEVTAVQSLNGARVTVVADVAENYQEARGLQLRLDVLDRGIATLVDLLSYVDARYGSG